MHEASLIKDLMRQILAVAEKEGGDVIGVSVWLGALSHMSPEHFREHYEQAAAGTIAEDAALDIESSNDMDHPKAQGVVLKAVEVAT